MNTNHIAIIVTLVKLVPFPQNISSKITNASLFFVGTTHIIDSAAVTFN